jgi:hypothetical protein
LGLVLPFVPFYTEDSIFICARGVKWNNNGMMWMSELLKNDLEIFSNGKNAISILHIGPVIGYNVYKD